MTYAGGNYQLAWEALKAEYEDKDTIDATDLKQSYYDAKMKLTDKPSRFLNKMKKIRKRLANEMKQKMSDKQFMLDMLAKLPRVEDDKKNLGPYQIERRFITAKIEATGSTYSIVDLQRDLKRVYRDLYGEDDVESDDEDKESKSGDDN